MWLMKRAIAFDFDGVICNGLREYFASSSIVYRTVWGVAIDPDWAAAFYQLRSVIHTGWEMPLILRALALGYGSNEILSDWDRVRDEILERDQITAHQIMAMLDQVRDESIMHNLDAWLNLHDFYPQIPKTLRRLLDFPVEIYIITTKEARFVKTILARENLNIPPQHIFGKEQNQSKVELLLKLKPTYGQLTFVEDRLPTLLKITQEPALNEVQLYLVNWGYNTEIEKNVAQQSDRITLMGLQHLSSLVESL
ncbi:MAG: HAD family hydrolase [Synechococcaceae cyanobacterium RL_1_2]|nr:HAD family hydrolase [Synechococcaceae cyanobacterium RL_1_2]